MKKWIFLALLFALPSFADETPCECEESPFQLPCERAWPYDAELETPPTWPGKREDSFYDWLTH